MIRKIRIKREICPGCRHDKHNHTGGCVDYGTCSDSMLTSKKCMYMTPDNILFDPIFKHYYCKERLNNAGKNS